jgi:hypothetical protein
VTFQTLADPESLRVGDNRALSIFHYIRPYGT